MTELERELEQESAAAAAADAAEEARLTTIIHDAELAVAVTVDELSDHFSGLAVDHGEAPSAAAAATAAASASAPTEALPAISTAQEFRAASQRTAFRHPTDYVSETRYDDQERCHRMPNEKLFDAYNATDDPAVRREVLQFSYSKANIFNGRNNAKHSNAERALRKGTATTAEWNLKGDQIATALAKSNMSDAAKATVMKGLMTAGDQYVR